MPKKKTGYVWTPGGPPPAIEAHSLAKHTVFAAYLKRYIEILAQNPRVSKLPITFVDGFAGGGIYRNELTNAVHEGSPLLILSAVKESEFHINQQRQAGGIRTAFEVCAHFHFIDIQQSNIDSLKYEMALRGHTPRINQDVYLHTGDFGQLYQNMIAVIKTRSHNGRCIFLLDQYGYDAVPMRMIQTIFKELHNAEVILTFATDHISLGFK